MNESFKPAPSPRNLLRDNGGKGNKTLLLILLLFATVIGYLYLFTGLFGQGTKASVQPKQNVMLRKTMPPRPLPIEKVKEAGKEPAVAEGAQPSAPHPIQVSPADEKQSKPRGLAATSSTVQPANGEREIVPQTQKGPAPSAKSPRKGSRAKIVIPAEKPLSAGPGTRKSPVAAKADKGSFTLLIGLYPLEKPMAAEKSRLNSVGLTPIIGKGPKKVEVMNRLLVAEFDNRPDAIGELARLKKLSIDAFILPGNGKYAIFAGSYITKGRAESERNRLIKLGIKPVVQKTSVEVPTRRLTAGRFTSRKEAEEKVLDLKKQGGNASIVRIATE